MIDRMQAALRRTTEATRRRTERHVARRSWLLMTDGRPALALAAVRPADRPGTSRRPTAR